MKLNKLIAGLTSTVMAASLAGCGGSANDSTTTTAATTTKNDSAASNDTTEATTTAATTTKSDKPIQLVCYSQLANSSGKQQGWFAEVLRQKFNVELTIIPDSDGMFDTRMESGNLGDIVIFGADGSDYQRAIAEGMLFDWNEDDILSDYGSYIKENMTYALEKNAKITESVTGTPTVHGFGHNVATTTDDHEAFFYTWDVRWDLYKQLNYPKVSNIDDLFNLFVSMKEINPKDENGNESYAVSLWPDWDGNMAMYVKAFATAYWGYDELGFGLYDTQTGTYHHALEEGGPYINSLKFFNRLYQANLIDPNSMTHTFNEANEKVLAGGTFFSIFNFAGSLTYNTDDHKAAGKLMYTLTPDDATPIAYGMNVMGGNRVWTIGANSEYPELCMEIINYLATPEGCMTYNHGPKDLCWYYDDEGYAHLTEFGETCRAAKRETNMSEEWGGATFEDGTCQMVNTTWSIDSSNPDSNGETYNADNWSSRRTGTTFEIVQDWMDHTGAYDPEEYLDAKPYKLAYATSYSESTKSDDLQIVWEQVKKCIVNYSWQAIYAKDDAAFDAVVAEMITKCGEYDPSGVCLQWCLDEAATRSALEDVVR